VAHGPLDRVLDLDSLLRLSFAGGRLLLEGELCLGTQRRLLQWVETAELGRELVIDMRQLSFIDLAGMRAVSAIIEYAYAVGATPRTLLSRNARRIAGVLPPEDFPWARQADQPALT
jgi:anti-anti-sigma regulatory factor